MVDFFSTADNTGCSLIAVESGLPLHHKLAENSLKILQQQKKSLQNIQQGIPDVQEIPIQNVNEILNYIKNIEQIFQKYVP